MLREKFYGKYRDGFTLIELMIVIAIIGILAVIAIPNFIAYRNKTFCSGMSTDAEGVANAIADYFSNEHYTKLPPFSVVSVGFKSENTFTYTGDPLTSIVIIVSDKSSRCPRGTHFVKTLPAASIDGFSN